MKGTSTHKVSRRSFIKGAAVAALAGMATLSGCSDRASEEEETEEASPEDEYDNTISDEVEDLNLVLLGTDVKIAAIIVAIQNGYFEEENLNISTQVVSGGFPEAMPALSDGDADVLPFGAISSMTYISQGDDLVIFGGTVENGSECITLIENKDKYTTAEDFRGANIGCFRMETGHMVIKNWLRENGIVDGEDVTFTLLESSAAEVAAVENGEIDMCFVNSGYGYVAVAGGKCAVAFRPNELIGESFPCCRQTANRTAFEEKRSALIKLMIGELRAMYDIENDHDGTIAALVDYSGQEQDYVEAIAYGTDDYTAAMTFEMDPYTDDVKTFYGTMAANGDLEDDDADLIDDYMDSTIYKVALEELIARGENTEYYEGLLTTYNERNTMGI